MFIVQNASVIADTVPVINASHRTSDAPARVPNETTVTFGPRLTGMGHVRFPCNCEYREAIPISGHEDCFAARVMTVGRGEVRLGTPWKFLVRGLTGLGGKSLKAGIY